MKKIYIFLVIGFILSSKINAGKRPHQAPLPPPHFQPNLFACLACYSAQNKTTEAKELITRILHESATIDQLNKYYIAIALWHAGVQNNAELIVEIVRNFAPHINGQRFTTNTRICKTLNPWALNFITYLFVFYGIIDFLPMTSNKVNIFVL
ncbi:MAG: hypothetical protein V1855_00475 [bacterium]